MKTIFLKFYVAAFYFCSTLIMFAAPGENNDTNDLESLDAPAPIGDYAWVMAAIGLLFVFLKFRTMYKQVVNSQG